MPQKTWTEGDLVSTLSGVLLKDNEEIDGLDEDLVTYMYVRYLPD
jgi:hypothetical protein